MVEERLLSGSYSVFVFFWLLFCDANPPLRPALAARAWSREKDLLAGSMDCPPFFPADAAKDASCEKLRFSAGTDLPPLLAISWRRSGDMEAKPRLLFFGSSKTPLPTKFDCKAKAQEIERSKLSH